jgi:hypothetical protein
MPAEAGADEAHFVGAELVRVADLDDLHAGSGSASAATKAHRRRAARPAPVTLGTRGPTTCVGRTVCGYGGIAAPTRRTTSSRSQRFRISWRSSPRRDQRDPTRRPLPRSVTPSGELPYRDDMPEAFDAAAAVPVRSGGRGFPARDRLAELPRRVEDLCCVAHISSTIPRWRAAIAPDASAAAGLVLRLKSPDHVTSRIDLVTTTLANRGRSGTIPLGADSRTRGWRSIAAWS